MTDGPTYKIIELRAENIKRLKTVEIRPDGALVQITGKNGAGKSSCLDAIYWALAGTRAVQTQPIRRGEERAEIHLDLGAITVTRKFKATEEGGYTTSLTVESTDGATFKSPQAMLDAIAGELSFDPLAFTRMADAEQFGALKAFVPGIDFEAIEDANSADYETRTAVNRRLKDLETQADAIVLPPGATPAPVDLASLEGELEQAGQKNAELAARAARRDQVAGRLDQISAQIMALEEEAATLRAQLEKADALPAPIDTTAIRERIAAGRQTNTTASAAARRQELRASATEAQAQSDALTKAIKDRTAAVADAVAKAKMPVPGITFSQNEKGQWIVLLNGSPFNQGSDAEQLRASIAIAGAMNSRLRIVRVRDGSLLDQEGLRLVAEYAEANDCQVWLERVTDGPVGFHLEDGQLSSSDTSAEPEEAL